MHCISVYKHAKWGIFVTNLEVSVEPQKALAIERTRNICLNYPFLPWIPVSKNYMSFFGEKSYISYFFLTALWLFLMKIHIMLFCQIDHSKRDAIFLLLFFCPSYTMYYFQYVYMSFFAYVECSPSYSHTFEKRLL